MMSEHERETAFLKHLILYDNTAERNRLEERIAQAQRDERCVRRAVWLMAVLTAVAVVGLCYSAVLLEDFPQNKSQLIIRVFCAQGLASLICLLAFVGFGAVYRKELNRRRQECRRLVTNLLESRLGKPLVLGAVAIVQEPERNEAPLHTLACDYQRERASD